nr:ABC transporter ATP-binding protein [uncultured Acetatifactor sp.]
MDSGGARMKCFLYTLKEVYGRGKKNCILYMSFSYLLIFISVLQLVLTQRLVNYFTIYEENMASQIGCCIGSLIAILYVEGLMTSLKGVCLSHLKEKGISEDENIILKKSCNLSVLDLDNPEVKNLRENAKRFSIFDALNSYVVFSAAVIKIVIFGIIMICYKCILLIPAIIVVLVIKAKLQKKGDNRVEQVNISQTESNRIRDYIYKLLVTPESLQEIRILKNAKYLNDKRADIYTQNYNEKIKIIKDSELRIFIISSITTVCNILSVCLLVVLSAYYGITSGGYVLLMQIVAQMYGLIPSVTQGYGTVHALSTRFEKYMEYINFKENPEVSNEKVSDAPIGVTIHNLSFKYPNVERDAINDVSIEIKPGEKIALVGENGSGKSTLVKLILGIYAPSSGEIIWSYDDKKSEKPINSLFKVVFQDFVRLWRPIRENIAMGDIENVNNDSMINMALSNSGSEKFIDQMDTYVGPQFGGVDLSGGQWQKLSIARSYMRKAGLAVFDEATSALDAKAELQQYQSFFQQGEKITSIIVTHRLALTRYVDRILVLHDGKIIESGNHEELYNLNGTYRSMYDAQSVFYDQKKAEK